MARGGFRPSAPQNNPASVSATGGNGQSGKYVAEKVAKATQLRPSGFPQGENKALAEQMSAGGNVASTASAANPASQAPAPAMGGIADMMSAARPITSEPEQYLPITDGVDFGPGRGSEVMPPSLQQDNRQIENVDLIRRYMPDLLNAARMPGAPDSYKRMINSLMREIM
jgi:hypothetical protein